MPVRRAYSWAWAALTTAAVAAGGVWVGNTLGGGRAEGAGGEAESAARARAPSSAVEYVADLRAASEQAYALLWRGRQLYFVGTTLDGALTLHEYDSDSGAERQWTLARDGAPGPFTFLSADADGALWVAAGYTIVAFDPGKERSVATVGLEASAPFAAPAATDPASRSAGTWVTGLAFDGRDVVVTRNNSSALFAVRNGGLELREVLPGVPRGLSRAGGAPTALIAVGSAGFPDDPGAKVDASAGCSLEGSPRAGRLVLQGAFGERTVTGHRLHPSDRLAVSGGYAAIALNADAAVLRFDCTGERPDELFPLEVTDVTTDSRRRGPQPTPGQTVLARHEVLAIAISDEGTIAFSDTSGRVAIIR